MGDGPRPGRRWEVRRPGPLPETERGFMGWITDLAALRGWRIYHTHDSRHSTAGWPDLALVRPPRLVLVEVKTDRGRLSADQAAWLADLDQCGPPEVFCWRPGHRPAIERILT